jgi:hypothetical protein
MILGEHPTWNAPYPLALKRSLSRIVFLRKRFRCGIKLFYKLIDHIIGPNL